MSRNRQMKTLSWADIGKRIAFTSDQGKSVEGKIRSVTFGVYSHHSKGEIDVPRVMVTIYAARSHEGHWADPETIAKIAHDIPEDE